MGRPTEFNQFVADAICERIADGESLRAICASDEDMPARSTVFKWLSQNTVFADLYARAREAQADVLFEEVREIADTPRVGEKTTYKGDGTVETVVADMTDHRRLQIDARKWQAGKLRPRVYGDKQFVEHSGSITFKDASDEDLIAELHELLAKGVLPLAQGTEIDGEVDDFSDLA